MSWSTQRLRTADRASGVEPRQPAKTQRHLVEKKDRKERNHIAAQMRTREVASLRDADVIVFVNNTQLDAADQLRLPKAPHHAHKELEEPAPFSHPVTPIPPQSPPPRVSGGDCGADAAAAAAAAAITLQPIIHHKHRPATHTSPAPMHASSSSGPFFFAASLTSQMKIHSGINP